MNSTSLHNDPYNPYYLPKYKKSYSVSNTVHSAQKRLPLQKPQDTPKFSVVDMLAAQLPPWAYCVFLGLGSLIGLALAIVFFGFILHFIIVHGSPF
jgi:hypothetical protein